MWGCDGCGKAGEEAKERYQNKENDFDFCEVCYAKKDEEVKPELKVATMVIIDLNEKKYWKRESNSAELTSDALNAMLQDYSDGKIESKVLTIGG